MSSTSYNKRDHTHCPPVDSPCGLKGEHRCCLCEEPVTMMTNQEKEHQDDLKEQFEKKFITFNTAGFRCLKGEGEEVYEFFSKALDSAYKEGQRDVVKEILRLNICNDNFCVSKIDDYAKERGIEL